MWLRQLRDTVGVQKKNNNILLFCLPSLLVEIKEMLKKQSNHDTFWKLESLTAGEMAQELGALAGFLQYLSTPESSEAANTYL